MDCEPVFDYGTKAGATGSTPARATTTASRPRRGSDIRLGLRTDLRIGFEGPRATARHRMKEGEQLYCALYWSEHPPPAEPSTRPTTARSGPRITGSTGSTAATFPTTRGARTCSAAR